MQIYLFIVMEAWLQTMRLLKKAYESGICPPKWQHQRLRNAFAQTCLSPLELLAIESYKETSTKDCHLCSALPTTPVCCLLHSCLCMSWNISFTACYLTAKKTLWKTLSRHWDACDADAYNPLPWVLFHYRIPLILSLTCNTQSFLLGVNGNHCL